MACLKGRPLKMVYFLERTPTDAAKRHLSGHERTGLHGLHIVEKATGPATTTAKRESGH